MDFVNIWDSDIGRSLIPSNEHILIFSKQNIIDNSSMRVLSQFNLDFDRQSIFLNGIKCRTRLSFLKCLIGYLNNQQHFDQLLGLCQQTIFGNIIKELLKLINNPKHVIKDGGYPVLINLTKYSEKRDISVDIKKQLLVVDCDNGNLVHNVLDINIISTSLFDPDISVVIKCQYKL